jgi:hypothetical protein
MSQRQASTVVDRRAFWVKINEYREGGKEMRKI